MQIAGAWTLRVDLIREAKKARGVISLERKDDTSEIFEISGVKILITLGLGAIDPVPCPQNLDSR
jgi:hypothetical protein